MSAAPLIQISEERKQFELRRALGNAIVSDPPRRRFVFLALGCVAWVVLGYVLLGLSFHVAHPDYARALFLGAILAGDAGPLWTLLISHWLEGQR